MNAELIVFEGLDGVGKSTLSRAVAERLGAEWRATPDVSLRAARELADASMANDPIALQLFYAATVRWASTLAREAISSGRSVVIDRYWASTVAYAPLRGDSIDLRAVQATLLAPTITVFVDVDEDLRRERLAARRSTAADIATLLQGPSLRESYRRTLDDRFHGRVLRVDNSGTLENTVATVLSALRLLEAA